MYAKHQESAERGPVIIRLGIFKALIKNNKITGV